MEHMRMMEEWRKEKELKVIDEAGEAARLEWSGKLDAVVAAREAREAWQASRPRVAAWLHMPPLGVGAKRQAEEVQEVCALADSLAEKRWKEEVELLKVRESRRIPVVYP